MKRLYHYACCDDMPDPTNRRKRRNIKNSDKSAYNCGGYALNTFNWYLPREADSYDDDDNDMIYSDTDETTDYMVNCMLKDFSGRLRIINHENETQVNETCIAFRVGDWDFHYAKRCKDNQWRHKVGDADYIDYMTRKELYSTRGWCRGKYNGKLVLMALKNS